MPNPNGPRKAGRAGPRGAARRRWLWAPALVAALAGNPTGAPGQPSPATAPAAAEASRDPAHRGEAIALDFPRGTGAALLRRGEAVLAVFDSPELRNADALSRRGPAAGVAEVRTLPRALVLVLPAASAPTIGLTRGPSGAWVLGPRSAAPAADGAEAGADALLAAAGPGSAPGVAIGGVPPSRVVAIRDPESGLPLLVGTTLEAGRGSPGGRRAPEYDLLRTELGVAVLARSEALRLQALPDRFLLSGSVLSPLSLDAAAVGPATGAAMTRCLGLPDLQPERLLARLRSQTALLAGTEPLARARRRRDLAATMLALGLGHEAQAEMNRAAAEDADGGSAPEGRALAAAAALVAGRTGEAAAVLGSDGGAPGCDELVLWRSLFLAEAGDAAAALPGLRATLPVLRSYPPSLRDRLLPLAVDAAARAGAWPVLRALLADGPAEARFPLAAATLAEADGDEEAALSGYDAAVRGRDRKARAAALRRAVELRLRTGRMDHAAAARAYGTTLVAWRGDAAEREARTRLAQLLASSGDPGAALALLRQTAALFPDHATALRRDAGRVVRDALDGAASPLAAVAAFQAGADLLPPEDREAAEARLVESLLALDLPARAAALLDEAAARAPAGAAKAEIGWRLAALRWRENDAAGARTALASTDAPELPEALRTHRAALAAEVAGRPGGAAPTGRGPEDAGGAEARAALGRRDWGAAARALGAQLDALLPVAPAPLDEGQQEAVLRLAAVVSLAGDDAALAALRSRVSSRMGEGPRAEAFARLFTGAGMR